MGFFLSANAPSSLPAPQRGWVNPFEGDVCGDCWSNEVSGVTSLQGEVVQRLLAAVNDASKPLQMLTSPRAGYGKTHALQRVIREIQGRVTVLPLVLQAGDEITWSKVSTDTLASLRQMPGKPVGWSRLREISAGIFTSLVLRLIKEGRLPCANREQALRVLTADATGLFQENSPAKPIGDWLHKHFERLRQPLAELTLALPGARQMEAWIEVLFEAARQGSATSLETLQHLATGSREGFLLWLRLMTLWRPLLLVADHLDGCCRQKQEAVSLATLLIDVAALPGAQLVLSVNQDWWQERLASHLPSALADRLTATTVALRGLTLAEALELLQQRLQAAQVPSEKAEAFERFVNLAAYFESQSAVSSRECLRHLAGQWSLFEQPKAESDAEAVKAEAALDEMLPALAIEEPVPAVEPASVEAKPAAVVVPSLQPGAMAALQAMMDRLRDEPKQPEPPAPVVAPELPAASIDPEALLSHFESLRQQMVTEAQQGPLDLARLGELIRLAGKRFPLVRFSEVELPDTEGRTALRWALQGQEIFFGIGDLQDHAYWRALAQLTAARVAAADRPAEVKLVIFKSDGEMQSWASIQEGAVIPSTCQGHVEALHLDTRSIAALYAVHRMIEENSRGQLPASPAQLLSVLARELDFFWKRVTQSLVR